MREDIDSLEPLHRLIHYICGRPQMFVRDGTFERAVVFIEGCDSGLRAAYWDISPERPYKSLLIGFQYWLSERLKGEKNILWLGVIGQMYSDDAEAFQKLQELFDEFMAEREARGG